jgi:telomerase reverse transcriptase
VGASVFGPNEIYAKLREFKSRLPAACRYVTWSKESQIHCEEAYPFAWRCSLYFVKLDVRACFDTIKQDKLLEIIQNILKEAGSV